MNIKTLLPTLALTCISALSAFADAGEDATISTPESPYGNKRPIYIIPEPTGNLQTHIAKLANNNKIIWGKGDLIFEKDNEDAQKLAQMNIFGLADLKATQMQTVIDACYILGAANYIHENFIESGDADHYFEKLVENGYVFGPLKETLTYAKAADTYISGLYAQREHLSTENVSKLETLANLQTFLTHEIEPIAIALNNKLREDALLEYINSTPGAERFEKYESLEDIVDEHIRRLNLAKQLYAEWKPQFDSMNENLFASLGTGPLINPNYNMDVTCSVALEGLAQTAEKNTLDFDHITHLNALYAQFIESGHISPISTNGNFEEDSLARLASDLAACAQGDLCILPREFASKPLQGAAIITGTQHLHRITEDKSLPIVVTVPADLWIDVHSYIASDDQDTYTLGFSEFAQDFPQETPVADKTE